MVILTNCLAEKVDEGCLKVANSLTKRIKARYPSTTILTYGNHSEKSDCHLRLNKLFLNASLFTILRRKKEPVLYIPFSSNTKASIFRTWILSLFCKTRIHVLFVLRHSVDALSRKLLQWSHARIITISKESYLHFHSQWENESIYLKTGVDVEKFKPVDMTERAALRRKYGIAEDEKVVLHIGHMKEGRNIRQLLQISDEFRIILVVSTLTKNERDTQLQSMLEARPNIMIMDTFLENIEEIYQLADVYFFPVKAAGNCIDVPLSAMEAAACNLPVVTTPYGELKELLEKDGFYEIESFEPDALNRTIRTAWEEKKNTRNHVLEYDWNIAVKKILSLIEKL